MIAFFYNKAGQCEWGMSGKRDIYLETYLITEIDKETVGTVDKYPRCISTARSRYFYLAFTHGDVGYFLEK